MSDLDFYAHVATRCDVLGAGIGSGLAAWEAMVGSDYVDDAGDGLVRRDYGLVELSFSDADGPLSCFGIGVQVHRLVHGPCVPAPLEREYGEFAPRARFEELRSVILSLGCTVEPDDLSGDIHRYRVPESDARILVIADPDPHGDGDHDVDDPEIHQAGDVWALSISPAWWGPR
ncbi:hypothetical protein LRS74_31890 [Streptomyces sp. LX-29]|uniref:hypothetical protein n=1 Tax=Streptomyces sp. LX-29 TaxID=2900152 RepID=UPI00240E3F5E|nr:hypothetical protein [Streptomyces sp. LX-29]WFB11129.1 hypothetical protein LRS74_31890 [Streptomyces sp. LX-29]